MKQTPKTAGYALLLWALTFLFFLRVIAEAAAFFLDLGFLPPSWAWEDPTLPTGKLGLIPYPILLPIQIAILLFQVKVSADFSRRYGFWVVPRPSLGRFLLSFSYLYFAAMALRYVASMAFFPERRWLGGTVPIFFHFVLAGFLAILARFHSSAPTKR